MPDPPPAPAARKPPQDKLSAPARALRKLGLARDIDLALHLPMRYVDETRIVPIAALRDGDAAQVQGDRARVPRRDPRAPPARGAAGRRQRRARAAPAALLPVAPEDAGRGPASCARAARCAAASSAARWCTRSSAPSAPTPPLPTALTPVYPSSAQLPQAYLRKAVASALARAPLDELLPAEAAARAACRRCARRCSSCTTRPAVPPGDAGRPQPPGLAAAEVRGTAGAAAVAGAGAGGARQRWRAPALAAHAERPARRSCWPRCPSR